MINLHWEWIPLIIIVFLIILNNSFKEIEEGPIGALSGIITFFCIIFYAIVGISWMLSWVFKYVNII